MTMRIYLPTEFRFVLIGAEKKTHRGAQSVQKHQTRMPRAQLRRTRSSARTMLQSM
jgi:hypothetical protein